MKLGDDVPKTLQPPWQHTQKVDLVATIDSL